MVQKRKNLEIKVTLSILVFIIISVFFVLIVSIVNVLFLQASRKEKNVMVDEKKEEGIIHRLTRFYPKTNEIKRGFSTLLGRLEEEESIFYTSSSDNSEIHTLISDFGTTEYMCSGSCYCEKEIYRRNYFTSSTTTTFSKRFLFLVASLSSIVAYNKAEEYFQEECKNFQEDCDPENNIIKSSVEDCEPLMLSEKISSPKTGVESEEMNEIKESLKEDLKGKNYECVGNCISLGVDKFVKSVVLPKKKRKKFQSELKKEKKRLICEELQMTVTFSAEEVLETSIKDKGAIYEKQFPGEDPSVVLSFLFSDPRLSSQVEKFVELHFANWKLMPFCLEQSRVKLEDIYTRLGWDQKEMASKIGAKFTYVCQSWKNAVDIVGQMKNVGYEQGMNPSIKCVRK